MRGHGTAYLAESVKFFSATRLPRPSRCVLTSETNASKISAHLAGPLDGQPATTKLPVRPTPEIHGA